MKRPTKNGYFGKYGGRFVAETLINALDELIEAYESFRKDKTYQAKLKELLRHYAGRPTPLYHAGRLSEKLGLDLYLKREDLLHTGAHKLNNTLGQILLTQYMGKKRVIAETGAGQHGVATATVSALMGMECCVYMGEVDIERQAPNVKRMELLGAKVIPVSTGSRTLKDAVNEALKDWVRNVQSTHYLIGSVVGPHPFPWMIREFQAVIGKESRRQFRQMTGSYPDYAVACVGGGSNAIGLFAGFINTPQVTCIGVEAGGRSLKPGDHAATLNLGKPGVLHGSLSYLLQDKEGQVMPVHSVSAGLDYPGVGPEHSHLFKSRKASYQYCSDRTALEACRTLSHWEGIIPALESSHALGYVFSHKTQFKGKKVLVNLSGRGDKDLEIIIKEVLS